MSPGCLHQCVPTPGFNASSEGLSKSYRSGIGLAKAKRQLTSAPAPATSLSSNRHHSISSRPECEPEGSEHGLQAIGEPALKTSVVDEGTSGAVKLRNLTH